MFELKESRSKHAMDNVSLQMDGNGHYFAAHRQNERTNVDKWFLVVEKCKADKVIGRWRVELPENLKVDSIDTLVAGPHVVAVLTGHTAAADDPNRHYRKYIHIFENIADVAGPEGPKPVAIPVAVQVAETGHTGGQAAVTEAEKEQIANLVVSKLRNEFGGNIPQGLLGRVRDALREEGVLTLNNIKGSAGLYERLRDTIYEELKKYGVIKEAKP